MDPMSAELESLCIDADDPPALARFWAAALRWEVAADELADGVALSPTDATSFRIVFRASTQPKVGPSRVHLHLTTESLDDQAASVAELVALGARHIDVGQRPEEGHVVLADPEGNEFCIIEPQNRFLADCERLGEIACDGTRAVGQFWSEAIGWPLVWDQDEETAIRAPDGTGPIISWGGPPLRAKDGHNRLRLELGSHPAADRDAAVEQLLALGARRDDRPAVPGGTVAMVDPDDNEFSVR